MKSKAPKLHINIIPKDIAVRAFDRITHDPEVYGKAAQSTFFDHMQNDWEELIGIQDTDVSDLFLIHLDKCKEKYLEFLEKKGKCFSSWIVGPANLNLNKKEKADKSASKAWDKYLYTRKRSLNIAIKKLTPNAELEENQKIISIKRKRDRLNTSYITMTKANEIVSDSKNPINELIKLGLKFEDAEKLLKTNSSGLKGFSESVLNEIQSEIRRLDKELEEAKVSVSNIVDEVPWSEGLIAIDHKNQRVKIFFKSKPSDSIRENLKKRAFRWSPKQKAWLRKLTNAAIYDSERLTEADLKKFYK